MNFDIFNLDFLKPDVLRPELTAFFTSFPITLLHALVTLFMLYLGSVIYAWLTPYKEVKQIREGNSAAAVSYGGVIFSLAVPLAVSMAQSTSLREIVIWGGATIVLQLFIFRMVDIFFLGGLPEAVSEDEMPAAVLLVAAKLGASIVLAAAVAG